MPSSLKIVAALGVGLMAFASAARAQDAESIAPDPAAEDVEQAPAEPERDDIEEIVVQAGESEAVADLQAGDSVTGFDASDLEALGAQSIEDLAGYTPNLEIVTTGSTTPTFFIRGVGLNDFNVNSSGSVAIYQDDVPKNSPAIQLGTLFDMEAVNVLRGPQGTGPSRSASAGAIKLYSRKPTGEFGGYLRSEFGDYNARDFEGAVEMPLYQDMLSSRFAFRVTQRDGTMTNRCGNLPPFSERPIKPRPVGPPLVFDGVEVPADLDAARINDPKWSYCGESVLTSTQQVGSVSPVPAGLPRKINDRESWAARGTFRLQPTLDSDFLLTFHGSKRDEYSRLGQSSGTNRQIEEPGCVPPDSDLQACRLRGVLGSPDGNDYQAPEAIKAIENLEAKGFSPDEARFIVGDQIGRKLDAEPYEGDFNRVGSTTNDVWGTSLKGEIAVGDSMMLASVTGYDTWDRSLETDLDASPNRLFELGSVTHPLRVDFRGPESYPGEPSTDTGWQVAQDISLSGTLPGELPVNWDIGGFLLSESIDVVTNLSFQPGAVAQLVKREYTQDLLSLAGYFIFSWDFWDDFTLDGGARYNWEQKDIDITTFRTFDLTQGLPGSNFTDSNIWQEPTGTIRLTYRFREDTHAYWKYSRGWKGGHYNATVADQTGITTADPESIDAFEIGLRGSWFQGKLGLDTSVFHYSYDNYQIFTIEIPLNSAPQFVVLNANDAEVYGAEVDLTARPLPGTFLQARFGWLESRFIDFVQRQATSIQIGNTSDTLIQQIDNSGNRLLNSPRFKVSLTGEQTVPLGRFGSLTGRWDGAWTDKTSFDASGSRGIPNFDGEQILPETTIGQKPYWIHNLRLGYRTPDGSVEVAGWIRNVGDSVYKTFAFDASALAFQTVGFFVGEPRTVGMSLTVNF